MIGQDVKLLTGSLFVVGQDVKELQLTKNPATEKTKSAEKGDGYIDMQVSDYICPVVGIEMSGQYRYVPIPYRLWGFHVGSGLNASFVSKRFMPLALHLAAHLRVRDHILENKLKFSLSDPKDLCH